MKISKKQLFSALILSFMFLFIFSVALVKAQAPTPSGGDWNNQVGMEEIGTEYGETPQSSTNLIGVAVRLINFSLLFLGVIFLGLLVMSGYQWMTAAGNEDAIEKAQSRMKNSIIGLIIVLAAWSITYFVFYKLALPATTGNNWYQLEYDTDPNTF
ncbi:MAG: pilin [Patescibacteria group bacterium]|jgi:hypothetical protein